MNPVIWSALSDAHRGDLLREACTERIVVEARQSHRLARWGDAWRSSTGKLVATIQRARPALTQRELTELCGCEVS